MYSNQFEHFTVEHGPQRALADIARRPLHHAIPSHEEFPPTVA
jgi:hypothetical protein